MHCKISMTIIKHYSPECGAPKIAKNYLEFTDGLNFSIKRDYLGESRLIDEVNKFKQAYNQGLVDSDDYDSFMKDFGPFMDIEKPCFLYRT